jgi:hypothetical protein
MAGDNEKGDSSSPRHTMVERIFGSMGDVPKLTKTNYHEWALEMQVNVESGNAERGKDRRALAFILRGVPPEMKSGLSAKKSVKDAWAAIKSLRMGDERVQEAKAQYLLKQFELAAFKDGEAIDDFAMRIDSLASELRALGENMEDERVVKKMLRVVPTKYNQIACSIEMFADLKKMSLDDLVGRLRVAEERCGSSIESAADGVGHLLLTEEQWENRRCQRSGKQRVRVGEGTRHDNGERCACRNDDHSDDDVDDNRSTMSSGSRHKGSRYRGRCFECNKRGHKAKDCPAKKKETALLADIDDEPLM